mmetsp:Transcript_15166/g.33920  ORF Transcript_15166/g.33920 Transcript_15166/m.33920 type:complete len:304 (+) Transcript_15166:130-1041(+)
MAWCSSQTSRSSPPTCASSTPTLVVTSTTHSPTSRLPMPPVPPASVRTISSRMRLHPSQNQCSTTRPWLAGTSTTIGTAAPMGSFQPPPPLRPGMRATSMLRSCRCSATHGRSSGRSQSTCHSPASASQPLVSTERMSSLWSRAWRVKTCGYVPSTAGKIASLAPSPAPISCATRRTLSRTRMCASTSAQSVHRTGQRVDGYVCLAVTSTDQGARLQLASPHLHQVEHSLPRVQQSNSGHDACFEARARAREGRKSGKNRGALGACEQWHPPPTVRRSSREDPERRIPECREDPDVHCVHGRV